MDGMRLMTEMDGGQGAQGAWSQLAKAAEVQGDPAGGARGLASRVRWRGEGRGHGRRNGLKGLEGAEEKGRRQGMGQTDRKADGKGSQEKPTLRCRRRSSRFVAVRSELAALAGCDCAYASASLSTGMSAPPAPWLLDLRSPGLPRPGPPPPALPPLERVSRSYLPRWTASDSTCVHASTACGVVS